MEEKAREQVKVSSSHLGECQDTTSSKAVRERSVWSPDQRYQLKGLLCNGNRHHGGALSEEAQTRGSRRLSLALLLSPTQFILVCHL